jgi:hypothetical protein
MDERQELVMDSALVAKNSRQCPECGVKLTRYEWSKLWWMSGMMSGRLVQPCAECGARLRLSSMALVSSLSSLALIGTALLLWFYPNWNKPYLYFVALALLLVILMSLLATRIETVPSVTAQIDPQPEPINRKRL